MTIQLLKEVALSRLDPPENHGNLSRNIGRVLIWGALGSGSVAIASSIFNRFLVQEDFWKVLVPHVFEASLTSCVTFTAIGAYGLYKNITAEDCKNDDVVGKPFNERVLLVAKGSTLVGLLGAAAAWGAKFATSNVQACSLAKHALSPLLGLGAVGSVLWIFHHWQSKQLTETI